MPRRKAAPEVNAGSMADIAFLLLIFFLVTTTIETDAGLDRMLPPIEPPDTDVVIKQKNIFTVNINKNGQLLVEDNLMELKDLRKAAIAFLENNADGSCTFCKGKKDQSSSDNPTKAIISLKNDRETKYSTYITVQNELVGAYNDLRNREAQRLYNRDFTKMEAEYLNPETPSAIRDELKDKVKRIQDMFPQKLSEAETSTN
ncbi:MULTISPECIES: ExbD/TolR family protein [Flagellimonas]|uniref:Biopolymer transporter ExbD n=2 Tax=Flagellimonas TaxID=444459 RepID=A0A3A1NII8_9FLAO|nr:MULTISPECIES: biopolymer transporter ExbD [Allomuricauda]RIV43063.1 biopolymer transporter ExbD [Allomuricauda maritima]RIV73736.1 biopolymer transporter ExbD [Allomuricauda aequoris]TXJ92263.1 biopolymer transporter ExbD [Allomuricauda maritima]TXK07420.1 biopolymer transporter ExbD [Allomuricauda aequoris]